MFAHDLTAVGVQLLKHTFLNSAPQWTPISDSIRRCQKDSMPFKRGAASHSKFVCPECCNVWQIRSRSWYSWSYRVYEWESGKVLGRVSFVSIFLVLFPVHRAIVRIVIMNTTVNQNHWQPLTVAFGGSRSAVTKFYWFGFLSDKCPRHSMVQSTDVWTHWMGTRRRESLKSGTEGSYSMVFSDGTSTILLVLATKNVESAPHQCANQKSII